MSFIHISFNFLYRIRNLVAEQAIEAMDFTFECRYPNCEFSANKTNLEAHERECENRHVVCRWCSWRVEFDTNEDHELSCGLRSSLLTTQVATVGHNDHHDHSHSHGHGHHHHQYYPQHLTHETGRDLSGRLRPRPRLPRLRNIPSDLMVNLHLNEENFEGWLNSSQGEDVDEVDSRQDFALDTAGILEQQPRRQAEGARMLQRRPSRGCWMTSRNTCS